MRPGRHQGGRPNSDRGARLARRARLRARLRDERGTVVAEFAISLPAVILLLAIVLGSAGVGAQHVRAQDAAADAARLLGRGESDARALALLQRALPGATLEAARTDGLVCVTVRAPARLVLTLPVAEVRGSSCALDDELAGVPPND